MIGWDIPPIFLCFFQSQDRVSGNFKKSIHKFELPGGVLDNGLPNLSTIGFYVDQEKFERFSSSKQQTVATGSLMYCYEQTLNNINAIHSPNELPPFYFHDYNTWCFINGIFVNKMKNLIQLTFSAFRTTALETSLNYIDQLPNIKLPTVRAGLCTLNLTFQKPTASENLQTLFVISIRPTILKIDKDRRISTSFTLN